MLYVVVRIRTDIYISIYTKGKAPLIKVTSNTNRSKIRIGNRQNSDRAFSFFKIYFVLSRIL